MADQIKFYLDEQVLKAVAEGLRRRGVDVVRVQEVGLISADDKEHLEFARKEGRVLFTQDADFLRLHASSISHSEIVYSPQNAPVGHIVRSLMLIYDILSSEEMINHIEFI